MLTVSLHRELDSRDQCNRLSTLVIKTFLLQVVGQFPSLLKILSVFPMVIDALLHLHRSLEILIAPSLWRCQMAQVSQSVAEVLFVLVVEILLQPSLLLLTEVLVDGKAAAFHCLGEHRDSPFGSTFHLLLLFLIQIEPTCEEDDSIVVVETSHLLGFHAFHPDMSAVITQDEIRLLRFEGVHHQDPCGRQPMAITHIPEDTQAYPNGKDPSSYLLHRLDTFYENESFRLRLLTICLLLLHDTPFTMLHQELDMCQIDILYLRHLTQAFEIEPYLKALFLQCFLPFL